MSRLISCEEGQKLDFNKHVNLQKDKSTQLSRSQLAGHPPTPQPHMWFCFQVEKRVGKGEGERGMDVSTDHQCPDGCGSGAWVVREAWVWTQGSMSSLFKFQPPPLLWGWGSGQHIMWEAGHQLHFLRNAVGLRHLSLANCFHYSKLSLREHALMDELSRI